MLIIKSLSSLHSSFSIQVVKHAVVIVLVPLTLPATHKPVSAIAGPGSLVSCAINVNLITGVLTTKDVMVCHVAYTHVDKTTKIILDIFYVSSLCH